ncbi:MAG: protein kinase [Cyanobacteria bacterium SZAS-4]|nr:protein kinase [Cyanobacteria bacterium SZAS-4]
MHFAIKRRPADIPDIADVAEIVNNANVGNDANVPNVASVAVPSHSHPTTEQTDEYLADVISVFRSDFADSGYENEQILAVTETSTIFKAGTRWSQNAVLVKLLRPELMQSRFAHKIFLQECAMVADLNHPNISPLYDYGIAKSGAPFMVSHFVQGWSLRVLNLQGLDVEPISLFTQICEGLALAHAQNVLHGNLSANKIIVSPVRRDVYVPKIIDLSVTAALKLQLPFNLASLRASASPEEQYGQDPDFRSDLYSLGHIMYETLTGSVPLFNRNKKVLGFSKLRGVPQLLEPLVVRCLAHEPRDRYESVNELLHDLREVESTAL